MITGRDQLIDALANNSSRIVIDKASIANAAAGQYHSLWRARPPFRPARWLALCRTVSREPGEAG